MLHFVGRRSQHRRPPVACQLTTNCPSPAVTVSADGAEGGEAAATGVPLLIGDQSPAPTEFTARTRTSYVVPLSRPVIVAPVLSPSTRLSPANCRLQTPILPLRRSSIAAPSSAGACQLTTNCPSPAVTVSADGAEGGEAAATGVPLLIGDQSPAPTEFTARTRTSYVVPLSRPRDRRPRVVPVRRNPPANCRLQRRYCTS